MERTEPDSTQHENKAPHMPDFRSCLKKVTLGAEPISFREASAAIMEWGKAADLARLRGRKIDDMKYINEWGIRD